VRLLPFPMIRFLILDVLFPLLVLFLIRAVFRSLFGGLFSSSSGAGAPPVGARQERTKVPAGGELRKDPVCGTYVSVASSVSHEANGKTVYFCSKECRDKYV
jgi:YHS domain-containing protein